MSKAVASERDMKQPRALLDAPDLPWLSRVPLVEDLRQICLPGEAVDPAGLMNIAAKYFFAFVHPGAQSNPVPPAEVAELLALFSRCRSLNEPGDDIDTMNLLRRLAPALTLPGDPGVAGRVLGLLLEQELPPGKRFLGLDLHAGSGLLGLGQFIAARRQGLAEVEVWGLEEDGVAARRAGALLRALGAGNVVHGSPSEAASYDMVGGRVVSLITAAAGPDPCGALCDERFFGAYAALFRACAASLGAAAFFPEGLIVYSRETNASLILNRENGFQRPAEFEGAVLYPQAWVVAGDVVPLHRMRTARRCPDLDAAG